MLKVGLAFLITIAAAPTTVQAASFGGFDCTEDCSGHAAGYDFARNHDITESGDCPYGDSESFHEGCIVHAQEPFRGSDTDDDGNDIDK